MTTQVDDPTNHDPQSSEIASALGSIGDLVAGTTLPAPIRQNALKAFSQLCAAAVEIPVAYLEGIAVEKRAESSARVKLINATADQIAKQLSVDPAYATAAVKKFGQRVVREQINLDKVAEVASAALASDPDDQSDGNSAAGEGPQIGDDWLNTFEKEASQKSTKEMQLLFGRILAGEIRKPSRFSLRTLKLAGELDATAARLFLRLCSVSVSLQNAGHTLDARVVSLGGNAGSNSLSAYGLNFDQLNVLHEYGFIIPDYNSYFDYRVAMANSQRQVALGFMFQGKTWGLVPTNDRTQTQDLRVHGVRLSKAGAELLPILDLEPNEPYAAALKAYFASLNLQMAEILTSKT